MNAAVRGTSHERLGTQCQDECLVDCFAVDGQEVLLAVVSDGAGSAARAEEGSAIACESFRDAFEDWLRNGGSLEDLDLDAVSKIVDHVHAAIEARAGETSTGSRDFACTLLAAIVGPDHAVFAQIGDGAIVVGANEALDVVFWPENGEYANMTYFVTDDDWPKHLHFDVRREVDRLAVMTDGLQRLALQFDSRSAHGPFFTPMFERLAASEAAGFADALETPLVAFLGSEAVNARSDDDKTLVLAVRAERSTHAAS